MSLQFGISGFYKCAITKCSLFSIAAFSSFTQFTSTTTHNLFRYDISNILNKHELSHLILSKIAFLDPSDFFFGCLTLYYFRMFERRFGSRKYLSSLLWLFTLSTGLELFSTYLLSEYGIKYSVLPSGPFFMIYPFFVYFFFDIPNISGTNSFVSPFSQKMFFYFVCLRLATSTPSSSLVFGCGVLTGLIYRYTFIQRIKLIPASVAEMLSRILSPVFATKEPKGQQNPIGATLEIQRQEALDLQEQRLMDLRRTQLINTRGRRVYVPRARDIQMLTEMGFNEERVRQALAATHGDLTDAVNLLQSNTFFQH